MGHCLKPFYTRTNSGYSNKYGNSRINHVTNEHISIRVKEKYESDPQENMHNVTFTINQYPLQETTDISVRNVISLTRMSS